jgi:DNA (cytosine-5)-methyltransferase 1
MAYFRQWSLLESSGVFADVPRWDDIPQFDPPVAPPSVPTPNIGGLVGVGFCGGGGSSLGLKWAGLNINFAMNHDAAAIAMHVANCPDAQHFQQNMWRVHPATVRPGEPIRFMWFSPDCTHFSRAKGAVPVEKYIRDLAWVIVLWMRLRRPDVVVMENVEEFVTWGPLMPDPRNPGKLIPDPDREGEYFEAFKAEIAALGYAIGFTRLRAYHYGSPTIRYRLFGQFRCDGEPISWPEATHDKPTIPAVRAGLLKPWRTIAECIDWTIKCPSIFLTREEARAVGCKRPLVDATMGRITLGFERYVLEAEEPYIVSITHQGGERAHSTEEPAWTQTTANRGEHALVMPHVSTMRNAQKPFNRADEPGVTDTSGGANRAVVAVHVTKFHGANDGQPMTEPAPTMTANGFKKRPGCAAPVGLVAAYMAQHNGGVVGHEMAEPLSTLTIGGCQQQLVAANLLHLRGSGERFGNAIDEPGPTDTAGGLHLALASFFLVKYYGAAERGQPATDPLHTDTIKPRFGLIMVDIAATGLTEEQRYTAYWVARMIDVWGHPEGLPRRGLRKPKNWGSLKHRALAEQIDRNLTPRPSAVATRHGHIVYDIGMRMLSVRERYRAQGVPDDFIIDVEVDGKPITATKQGQMCGNMVCPQVAEAIARAALPELSEPTEAKEAA